MFWPGKGLECRFLGREAPSGAFLAGGWPYSSPPFGYALFPPGLGHGRPRPYTNRTLGPWKAASVRLMLVVLGGVPIVSTDVVIPRHAAGTRSPATSQSAVDRGAIWTGFSAKKCRKSTRKVPILHRWVLYLFDFLSVAGPIKTGGARQNSHVDTRSKFGTIPRENGRTMN